MTTEAMPFAPHHAASSARRAATAGSIAQIDVYDSAAPVLEAWAELEALAPASIYQTRAWLLPWIETLGAMAGLRPLFVLARSADGRPSAMLCLGIARRGPLRVATWLGGKDANFNMPLVRPGVALDRNDVTRLLKKAARGRNRSLADVFILSNQPEAWGGVENPFALLPRVTSPSAAYGTSLCKDAEAVFAAKLSKETRKKMRKKEARLAAFGPVTHEIAADADAQRAILDTFVAQKTARFRALGIPSQFDAPEMRAFITAASAPCGTGIELHALRLGDRIIATYAGAAHGGQWSGMFSSFDADEAIARNSPGDLLLMRVMARACMEGLDRFDLGVGEAQYKGLLCDEAIPLFDAIVSITLKGRVWAAVVASGRRAKRAVKQNERLFSALKRARAMVKGRAAEGVKLS